MVAGQLFPAALSWSISGLLKHVFPTRPAKSVIEFTINASDIFKIFRKRRLSSEIFFQISIAIQQLPSPDSVGLMRDTSAPVGTIISRFLDQIKPPGFTEKRTQRFQLKLRGGKIFRADRLSAERFFQTIIL